MEQEQAVRRIASRELEGQAEAAKQRARRLKVGGRRSGGRLGMQPRVHPLCVCPVPCAMCQHLCHGVASPNPCLHHHTPCTYAVFAQAQGHLSESASAEQAALNLADKAHRMLSAAAQRERVAVALNGESVTARTSATELSTVVQHGRQLGGVLLQMADLHEKVLEVEQAVAATQAEARKWVAAVGRARGRGSLACQYTI